ncbi:hypothetical protein HDE76_000260 [Rhodanobacter sp. ANJX3]|uniref:hypothetical protein n=1 Tax=unclassified Rhodanobacter TaxID=2621553 RepID=UPI0015CABC49|nr:MULTISPECIES: hypothetical protein [unclassified Rhodanobacter]MBB5357078.1 hypothetical protein [Rhodanobacter sp. ANJX3]NYE27149.1 hypothetical protein [Rhodanobacter sp. K2T2]
MTKINWTSGNELTEAATLTFGTAPTSVDHVNGFIVVAGAFFVDDVGWYGQWSIAEMYPPNSYRLLHDGITFDVRESELEARADARIDGLSAAATIRPHVDRC